MPSVLDNPGKYVWFPDGIGYYVYHFSCEYRGENGAGEPRPMDKIGFAEVFKNAAGKPIQRRVSATAYTKRTGAFNPGYVTDAYRWPRLYATVAEVYNEFVAPHTKDGAKLDTAPAETREVVEQAAARAEEPDMERMFNEVMGGGK